MSAEKLTEISSATRKNVIPIDTDYLEGTKEFDENPSIESNWKKYLVTSEPEEVPPLLTIGDVPVWTTGNHSLIIGKSIKAYNPCPETDRATKHTHNNSNIAALTSSMSNWSSRSKSS